MSQPIDKGWMNIEGKRRSTCPIYRLGVKDFIDFAKANNDGLTTCPCPCSKCRNSIRETFEVVKLHLECNGIDTSYRVWSLHGENLSNNPNKRPRVEETLVAEKNDDEGLGMRNLVDAFFGVHGVEGENDDEEPYVPEPDLGKRYHEYKKKAEEKLYPSCEGPHTTLSAIVELHNLKKKFGWSGTSVTALLSLLRKWLPTGNTFPSKYPIMKEMLKDLGMKANCIHVCKNNCILYWKEHENAIQCPQCHTPRFKLKVGSLGRKSKEPHKILRHFPLIPRLKRLYTIPWIAHDMTWHHRAESSWEYMRHPVDSAQWKLLKEEYPDFANVGRNVWLAMATDGFNPRGIQSTGYSCWPVIIVPYNLPPSLCLKSEFQMMSLLIPGPKAPGQDMDVFLQPLVYELLELWEGVPAYDTYNNESFTLRSLMLWGIHDFPAYGNMSGCVTHGYKACPVCGDDTPSVRLVNSKKIVYTNYRMFLKPNHPFRSGKHLGLRTVEDKLPPKRLNGPALLEKLSLINYIPGKVLKKGSEKKASGSKRKRAVVIEGDGDAPDGGSQRKRAVVIEGDGDAPDGDYANANANANGASGAYYKMSIFFKLKYWINHQIRHGLDVMHIEKNFAEHLLNTITGKKDKTKDTINAREDMRIMGIHSGQWMKTNEATGKPEKPKAPFLLNKEENRHFFLILKNVKLPSGFSSNLSNIVSLDPPGLLTMKSHDYHVIMQYLLPVLLQHAFPKYRDLRRAIHQISLFFNILCSKVIIREEMQAAKSMVGEAMCVLEKYFPPSFFDISIHLVVHLADEALICGTVRQRWMYPFERSMKECKGIPSNKRYVEGSIAESYLVSESVRYAMEYMPNPRDGNHKATRELFLDEDSEYIDEGPLRDGKMVTLRSEQFVQIRRWLLFRLDVPERDDYYSEYCTLMQSTQINGKGVAKTEVETQTEFITWLYNKLVNIKATNSMLWRLVQGPLHQAKTYIKYRSNGFVFATKSHDDSVVTQDSGVCMQAITTCTAGTKDKRHVDASITYYGVIQEIIEVDYTDFKEVVFYCDWIKVEDKTHGCKLCPDSNLVMVNFKKWKSATKAYDEPVILASEASQVFYSQDLKNPNWWVVIYSPKRVTKGVDDLGQPTMFQSTIADQPNLKSLFERQF